MSEERENILRLLRSGDIANVNLALQILSSEVVEWGRDIELSICDFLFQHLPKNKAITDANLFGLTITTLENQEGNFRTVMLFDFLGKHTWKLFFRL